LGAAGAAWGCEERVKPIEPIGPIEPIEAPTVAAHADLRYLSSEPTPYQGDSRQGIDDQVVNDVLLHRAEPNEPIVCQMLTRPTWKYETAIFLRRSDVGWQLIARRAIVSLGEGVSMRLSKGMDRDRIVASLAGTMEESVRPISQPLASALQRVWTDTLLRTRVRSGPELDPDATFYSFAHHHLAGVTMWSDEQSMAGRLVQIGGMLLEATLLIGVKYEATLEEVRVRAVELSKYLSRLHDLEAPSSFDLERLYGETTHR
jgi:hypothetical protein